MKISVIIPSYKPKEYLWECLNSLHLQTFSKMDFEILLILNGCSEPYFSQINSFIKRNNMSNVNLIQTDQPGVSNARNIGLDNAKGEYVSFIDDDDFVSPSYLEELYEHASFDTISLCYPYNFEDGNIEKQLQDSQVDVYNYFRLNNRDISISSRVRKYFSGPYKKLIPTSLIQGKRFDVRYKIGEDSLFMFLISDKYKFFSFTSPNAIYYRRIRANSAITSKRSFFNRLVNSFRLIATFSYIYFKNFPRYNFLFYLTRVLGQLKCLITNHSY